MVFSFDLESFGWKQGPYWLQPCSLRWLHRQNGRGNEVWDYAGAAVAVPGFCYKMMVLVVKWYGFLKHLNYCSVDFHMSWASGLVRSNLKSLRGGVRALGTAGTAVLVQWPVRTHGGRGLDISFFQIQESFWRRHGYHGSRDVFGGGCWKSWASVLLCVNFVSRSHYQLQVFGLKR